MLILANTTDKIEVVLAAPKTTNHLPVYCSYRDITTLGLTPGRNVALTNDTTDVSLSGSPAASTQRVVDMIGIYNRDTVSASVTVKYDANGTEYVLWTGSLSPGECLHYAEGRGFYVLASGGANKTTSTAGLNPVNSSINRSLLAADQTNSNGVANTIQDVTGLSFGVNSGSTYWFRFLIWYTAAATTTGSRWAINGPTTSTLIYSSRYSLTTTTVTSGEGLTAYDLPAASNASSAAIAGNIAMIEGFITPTANGTVIARFASEILSSAIVAKAGSFVDYQQIA